MSDELAEDYPEAAPYIRNAVEKHGEEWVIENYSSQITNLGVVMNVPPVEELPFYDEEKHDVLTDEEKRERAAAYQEYRENLREGTKPDDQ